jgi:hypothetical protein
MVRGLDRDAVELRAIVCEPLVDLFLGTRNVRSRGGNGSCFLFARLGGALIHQTRGAKEIEVRVEAEASITLLPRRFAKNA